MRLFKKVAALLLAVSLAVPAMSVAAADDNAQPSAQTKPISGTTASATYDGNDHTDLIKFTDADGAELTEEDYTITAIEYVGKIGSTTKADSGTNLKVINAGTYTVTAEGKGAYEGNATTTVTIAKADPQLKTTKASVSYQMYKIYNTSLSVPVAATTVSDGKITYSLTKYGVNRGFSISGSTVSHPANSYRVGDANVYASVAETLNYKGAKIKALTITIKKSYPHIQFANQKKTFKKSAVDSKARTYKLGATGEPGTKLAYKVVTGGKYISVSKAGKVTVKKGTPKGKYKIQVYNTNTSQYYAGPKNCYVTVK